MNSYICKNNGLPLARTQVNGNQFKVGRLEAKDASGNYVEVGDVLENINKNELELNFQKFDGHLEASTIQFRIPVTRKKTEHEIWKELEDLKSEILLYHYLLKDIKTSRIYDGKNGKFKKRIN